MSTKEKLTGFRVPGSKFRRIPEEALVQFMLDHHIPLTRISCPIHLMGVDAALLTELQHLISDRRRFPLTQKKTFADALVSIGTTAYGIMLVNVQALGFTEDILRVCLAGSSFPQPTYHIVAYNAEHHLDPHVSMTWPPNIPPRIIAADVKKFLRQQKLHVS